MPYADLKGKRIARWFWVPAADAEEVTYDEQQIDGQVADEETRTHRRAFNRLCGYLEESDVRSTSTVRDTGEPVFVTLANPPAPQLFTPPPIVVPQGCVPGRTAARSARRRCASTRAAGAATTTSPDRS
ncbi:hypothetical protein AB0B48_04425 [Micromonospora sp. NPDC049089]|uniref:hypothetical protein n=1 Tax=Micromonospora sp. NPDC049089 TaxID=3155496 RepID=UPI00340AF7D8